MRLSQTKGVGIVVNFNMQPSGDLERNSDRKIIEHSKVWRAQDTASITLYKAWNC
jgi:hypothetical protein